MSDNGLETLLKILKFPENLNHPHVEDFPHFLGDLRGKLEASLERNKQNPTFCNELRPIHLETIRSRSPIR